MIRKSLSITVFMVFNVFCGIAQETNTSSIQTSFPDSSIISEIQSDTTFSSDSSSVLIDSIGPIGGENLEETVSSKINNIKSFSDFFNSEIWYSPCSNIFSDCDIEHIHNRKYDFYNVQDTFPLILGDTIDCRYFHPVNGRVTSEFGVRRWRFHYGIDLKLNRNDPVRCAFDGFVRISKYSRTYGNVIVIRHENGLETLYGHLSKRLVKINDYVNAGEIIGLGGNTGRSYGNHLHLETRYFDEAINPRDIIDFDSYCLISDTLYLCRNNFKYRDLITELEKIRFHTVRKGDTLSHIAVKYGTSVRTLCRLNGISPKKVLRLGMKLRVR
ncbi:MAG: peptidoglycan DD-metalloendopeptidase family protein [Bacteroidia bacterium]|nr:peptidoglycan DD-metalloendopeptidase family protein [Bacteroidia bacterium]